MADMGERRPHLLTVDDPLVAVEDCARLHVGEIAARVGFAVALAPPLCAVEDSWEEAGALRVGAELDQRRPEEVLAHVVHTRRCLRPRVLLGPDDLLRNRRAASSVGSWPPDPDPPGRAELSLPLDAQIEADVLIAGAAAAAQRGVIADDVIGEPATREVAELFIADALQDRE